MSVSRTIDNLGIETSVRYASDLETLDTNLLKESQGIPLYVKVDVTSPDFMSNIETMLGARQRNLPFPDFYPPKAYNVQSRYIFTHQILPNLGSDEKLLNHIDRIGMVVEREKEKRKGKGKGWEEEQEQDQREKESEKLIAFLQLLQKLDKILVDVATGRNLYQKG
jgi:hypothetical protein